jgi:hypothetical protein
MNPFELNDKSISRLHELADLQHPHLKGDNHTRYLIDKVYKGDTLNASEAFDCGKYYQRMLEQLKQFESDRDIYSEYLHAILDFKHTVYNK